MSQKRQSAILDPRGHAEAEVTTLAYDYPDAYAIPEHFHREDQLVFASGGVMTIRTLEGVWVVPPLRAVWIPGATPHSIRMSGAVSMRTLYFAPRFLTRLPRHCFVMAVPPLLRELVLHVCESQMLRMRNAAERLRIELVTDLLGQAKAVPLQLPGPRDPRARRVAEILLTDPTDGRTLLKLCQGSGASKRTVERLFLSETGLGFGKWRQQLRLLEGIRLIASGESVTEAALGAGYSSSSAFVSAFRRTLGETPRRYGMRRNDT